MYEGELVSLRILDAKQVRSEMDECYPGIWVKEKGFVPIAADDSGGGDYYYINIHEKPQNKLYRIIHDAVSEDGTNFDYDAGIEVVLTDLDTLIREKARD